MSVDLDAQAGSGDAGGGTDLDDVAVQQIAGRAHEVAAHAHRRPLAAPQDARRQLRRDLPDRLVACDQFTFLGSGWTVGLANEAALKLREASRSWTESYPAMEFRHGPISVVDEGSAVWLFGPAPAGLVDEITATGALVVQANIDPMADLVSAQRLAVALAGRKGLDPDSPRHLTRSIILADQ